MTTTPPVGGTPPPEKQPPNPQELKKALIDSIHTFVTLLKQARPNPNQVSAAIINLSNRAAQALKTRGE